MSASAASSFRHILILAALPILASYHSTTKADDKPNETPLHASLPRPHNTSAVPPRINLERLIVLTGRVTDHQSNPVANARMMLTSDRYSRRTDLGTTAADGTYRFEVPERQFHRFIDGTNSPEVFARLIAETEYAGPAIYRLSTVESNGWQQMNTSYEMNLSLTEDQPITGFIRGANGQPLGNVLVSVIGITELSHEYWKDLVDALDKNSSDSLDPQKVYPSALHQWTPEATWKSKTVVTDSTGQFRIAGLGRDRVIFLRITGAGIAPREVAVITRNNVAEFTRKYRDRVTPTGSTSDRQTALFDSFPTIEIAAVKTVAGRIIDSKTGDPVSDVRLVIGNEHVQSDEEGRFRTVRTTVSPTIRAIAYPNSQRYLVFAKEFENPSEDLELVININLEHGTTLFGQAVEAGTGRPIISAPAYTCHAPWPGALRAGWVHYVPLEANEALRESDLGKYLAESKMHLISAIQPDGSFQLAVPSGPGMLLVESSPGHPDLVDWGTWSESAGYHRLFPYARLSSQQKQGRLRGGDLFNLMGFDQLISVEHFHAYQFINPSQDVSTIDALLELHRLPTRVVEFVDMNNARVAGVMMSGAYDGMRIDTDKSELEVMSLEPDERRRVVAASHDGRLIGHGFVNADTMGPARIRLEKSAAVTGRLIDKSTKKPLANYFVSTNYQLDGKDHPGLAVPMKTDFEGNFQLQIVMPNTPLSIEFRNGEGFGDHRVHRPHGSQGIKVQPDEIRDLKEIVIDTVPPAKEKT